MLYSAKHFIFARGMKTNLVNDCQFCRYQLFFVLNDQNTNTFADFYLTAVNNPSNFEERKSKRQADKTQLYYAR